MTIRRTVAVASGKGGVGKSTLSLNVAIAAAQAGLRVGLLDADLYGPDLALMVGVTRRRRANAVTVWRNPPEAQASTAGTAVGHGAARIKPLDRYGIRLMSAQFLVAEDQALAWSTPLIELLLMRFAVDLDWGDLDLLLVDLPPGTADVQQLVIQHFRLDGALIVVTPQDVAHLDAKKVVSMFQRAGVRVVGAVENMSGLICPCCRTLIDVFPRVPEPRSLWSQGITRLGQIPLDPVVAAAGDAGMPSVSADPNSATSLIIQELTRTLIDTLS